VSPKARTAIKAALKIIGTLGGILGIAILWIAALLFFRSFRELGWTIILVIFPAFLGAYFIYMAYLVWFRFSPRAVHHTCIGVGLCLFSECSRVLGLTKEQNHWWVSVAAIGCIIALFFLCRTLSRWLNKVLFVATDPYLRNEPAT
jgi:hypothetical protein